MDSPLSNLDFRRLPSIHKIICMALVVVGFCLRFHALSRQSLWDDEASTLQTIHTPWNALLERHATYETHPPLYFLQLRVWEKITGSSLTALRANSAFWGTLSLLAIFALADAFGLGLLVLGLAVFSPLHLAYSQEMRPYAFGFFLSVMSFWSVENIVGAGHRPRPPSQSISSRFMEWPGGVGAPPLQIVLWTCLLYTHYWGAFVCLAGGVYGLCAASSMNQRYRLIMAGLISVGLFAFWMPVLHRQLQVIGSLAFWVPLPSVINMGKTLVAFTGLYFRIASTAFQTPAPRLLLAVLGASYGVLLIRGWRAGPRLARYWLALGLLVPCALSYYAHGLYLWYRYPLFMFPAFLLLVAAGLQQLKCPALRGMLIGLLMGAELAGVWHYFSGWQKANPKTVVSFIEAYARPGMVVVRPAYFSFLYTYYDHGRTTVLDTHVLDSPEKRAALRGHLIFLVAFDVPRDPIKDAFLKDYHLLGQRYFPGTAHLGITVYILK